MTRPTATHDALGDARLQEYTAPQASLGEHGWRRPWTTRGVERAEPGHLPSGPGHAHGPPRDRDRRCEPLLVTQRPRRRAGCAATGLAR